MMVSAEMLIWQEQPVPSYFIIIYGGRYESRILGDDRFSEKTLAKATEKYIRKLNLEDVIAAVCSFYNITPETLADPGKARPASEARALTALLKKTPTRSFLPL